MGARQRGRRVRRLAGPRSFANRRASIGQGTRACRLGRRRKACEPDTAPPARRVADRTRSLLASLRQRPPCRRHVVPGINRRRQIFAVCRQYRVARDAEKPRQHARRRQPHAVGRAAPDGPRPIPTAHLLVQRPGRRAVEDNGRQAQEVLLSDRQLAPSSGSFQTPDDERVSVREALSAMISGGNATVYVSNMDAAVRFYTQNLGLTLTNRVGNHWATIEAGPKLLDLRRSRGRPGHRPASPMRSIQRQGRGARWGSASRSTSPSRA